MIGKQILNYEIKSLIGEGGMGNVYLAEHLSIGRKVAIKALRPELASNDEIRNRFKNEAKVMAKLQHPNIVSLFDYHEDEDGLYLIMEYVEGRELKELLEDLNEPLPIDRAITLMKRILDAFAYAHKNGIIHRDVKPSNILITNDDEVKILDFGIAKLIGDAEMSLTKTGTKVGTVYYMSPEQVKAKELDKQSDIYSLGVTFYEALAGYCPYTSMNSEYEVYDKIVREPLVSLVDSMGDEYQSVWNAIEKATQKEPEDRFQDCGAFTAALDKKVKAKEALVTPKKERTKAPIIEVSESKSNGSNPTKKILLFAGGAAILFTLIWFFFLKQNTGDSVDDTGTFVIVKTLNFRDGSTINSNSIGEIHFGEEVELLEDMVGPILEDKTYIIWQKIIWNGKEGWIASSIDDESTIGSTSDMEDIKKLANQDYMEDSEYDRMRRWAQNEIIEYLKNQGWQDEFHYVYHNAEDRDKGYRALVKYHTEQWDTESNPYDYVALIENNAKEKIALFLVAEESDLGGELVGNCLLPDEAKYLKFNENNGSYSIDVIDENYRSIGGLDDKNFKFNENYGEISELQIHGDALVRQGMFRDEWQEESESCANFGSIYLCYDSFRIKKIMLIGNGSNLRIEYKDERDEYSNFTIDNATFYGSYIINEDLGYDGTLSVYSGSERIFNSRIHLEGCL